jgi:mevalonate kinase
MKFKIPAKTFLLGEYVALQGGPAIILTTEPCFEVGLGTQQTTSIHEASPAGRFWAEAGMTESLTWFDPYQGVGGLGASSAQFLGAYFLYCELHQQSPTEQALLDAYWRASFESGRGMRPSGYDVLAQAYGGCVYLHRNQAVHDIYAWPFDDIAFVLLHTGQKLATHTHLEALVLPEIEDLLAPIVALGQQALEQKNSVLLIDAVNTYAKQLQALDLVAPQTEVLLRQLAAYPDVLAAKGCGAMGADVLLALVPASRLNTVTEHFSESGFSMLASSHCLYQEKNLDRIHFTS